MMHVTTLWTTTDAAAPPFTSAHYRQIHLRTGVKILGDPAQKPQRWIETIGASVVLGWFLWPF